MVLSLSDLSDNIPPVLPFGEVGGRLLCRGAPSHASFMQRPLGLLALAPWLLLAGCRACAGPAPAPNPDAPWPVTDRRLGPWGEDLSVVADFSLPQERRAPKLPDAGDRLAELGPVQLARFDQGLLICHVEIYSRNGHDVWYRYKLGDPDAARPRLADDWDRFAGPDVLLQVRLRGADPISLFGPEDHWGFFVSIPRVGLGRGDRLEVRLWDRDGLAALDRGDVELIGGGALTWDGQLPLALRGPYFALRCGVLQRPEAERRAAERLATIDARLGEAEQALGAGRDPWQALNAVTQSYGEASLRYAAGFLGWEDPQIRQRGLRLRRLWAAAGAGPDGGAGPGRCSGRAQRMRRSMETVRQTGTAQSSPEMGLWS